jgi:regulator of replication initiation timing
MMTTKNKHSEQVRQIYTDIQRMQDRIGTVTTENLVIKEELQDLSFVREGNAKSTDL